MGHLLHDSDRVEPTFYKVDANGSVHPCASKDEWMAWMDAKGKNLKVLIPSGGALKIGLKFIGKENGWSANGSPNLWLAAVLVNKKVITTLYVESFDEGVRKLQEGLENVAKSAPWTNWISLKILDLKLKYRKTQIKSQIFQKIL